MLMNFSRIFKGKYTLQQKSLPQFLVKLKTLFKNKYQIILNIFGLKLGEDEKKEMEDDDTE